MPEIWDLYDGDGKLTGQKLVRGEEIPQGLYHIGVHIWPINHSGSFLIQKRADNVQWKPGIWAATGGSAISGEDPLTAAMRELREELGVEARPEEMQCIQYPCGPAGIRFRPAGGRGLRGPLVFHSAHDAYDSVGAAV